MVSKSGCIGWLKKRTNLEKTLLSLSSLLFLTLLLVILIGIVFRGKKGENALDEDKVCWNTECIKAAGDVLSIMHPTTDSCTNFYDFACGKYGQEPGQTISVPRRSTESVYFTLKQIMESEDKLNISGLDDARKFYNSCVQFGSYRQDVDETGGSLLNLMDDLGIGIWPIVDPLYDTSKFSLENTLVGLILLDVPVVFRMEIVPDEHLAGSYLIKISPGGPRETGRSPSDIRNDVHLRSSVLTSFLLLGASSPGTDVYDILSVDSSFAAIEQDKSAPCDDVTMLAPEEAVSELNRLMPEIDWNIIISEIRNATGLRRSFAVKLHCKQKIRDYVVHLNDLTLRSETNYLGWRFFSKFVEHVIPTFEKSQFGMDEVIPRWRVCLQLMEKFASPVLADVLIQKMVNKEIQNEVERISSSALAAAKRLVSRAKWLNDSERSRIREKVAKIRMRYPFQKKADKEMSMTVNIPKVDVSNFTAVVISRQREWVVQKFKQLNQEDDIIDLTQSWYPMLSARGDLSSDYTVFVYFDKIKSPYIRFHGSRWLNYGGFGVAVAREISQVLMAMNPGKIDDKTMLWNMWSRSRNSSLCLDKSLASRLTSDKEGVQTHVTERLMQDIFVDHSSLEIAYETALDIAGTSKSLPGLDLSNERLFFLSYAQTLCDPDLSTQMLKNIPVKDRLNTAVLSFELFNKAFGCELPSSRCQIWA